VRRDKIVRVLAVIGLSAIVYYFSFEQGRISNQHRIEQLEGLLAKRQARIEALSADMFEMRQELERLREQVEAGPEINGAESIGLTVRLGGSRILYDARLVVSCLAISRDRDAARIQVNLIAQGRVIEEEMGLGQSMTFPFDGGSMTVILEGLRPSQAALRLLPVKAG
jgi:hypothetical protein